MNECDALRDRMPALAAISGSLSDWERHHLAACAECAAEWRVIQLTRVLHGAVDVDADRIAANVTGQMRTDRLAPQVTHALPWRAAAIGVLAMAACALLVLALPRHERPVAVAVAPVADSADVVLPELAVLDDAQLQALLQSIGPAPTGSGPVPRLDDLTDAELEQLLRSEGGE